MKSKNNNLDSQFAIHDASLVIGWLYPQLMSTYGDRGNILVLQKRCEWRGIKTTILPIDQHTTQKELESIDLLFGGGAQDREQEIVIQDLSKKQKLIKQKIETGTPALFVCGAPQLFGNYYEPAEGKRIEGLGIFDMISKHPEHDAKRLIGNVVAKIIWKNFSSLPLSPELVEGLIKKTHSHLLVGFENHGGRTYLQGHTKPLATIIKGNGNNGEDGTEGMVYKNAIGTYLHGPLLPKNPQIADWLIATALAIKYGTGEELKPLQDFGEQKAKETILNRFHLDASTPGVD